MPCMKRSLELLRQATWEVRLSTSRGVPYFYNVDTRESMWEAPPDLTQEQIAALPGAKQLLLDGSRPAQVRASHLLVKHSGSRRPSSWKEVRIQSSHVLASFLTFDFLFVY